MARVAARPKVSEAKSYEMEEKEYPGVQTELIGLNYTVNFEPDEVDYVSQRLRYIRVSMMRTLRVPILTIQADPASKSASVSVVPRIFVKTPTPDDVQAAFRIALVEAPLRVPSS